MKEFKVKYYEMHRDGNLEKEEIITKTIKAKGLYIEGGMAIFTYSKDRDSISDVFSKFISVESVIGE